eukprot:3597161-Prymnesium_polylepis.1
MCRERQERIGFPHAHRPCRENDPRRFAGAVVLLQHSRVLRASANGPLNAPATLLFAPYTSFVGRSHGNSLLEYGGHASGVAGFRAGSGSARSCTWATCIGAHTQQAQPRSAHTSIHGNVTFVPLYYRTRRKARCPIRTGRH